MPIPTTSGAPVSQPIPKLLPPFLHRYVGNRHLFKFLIPLEARIPIIAQFNSVLNIAPTFKWALSIVPLIGIFSGNPPVEKLDVKQTFALLTTGCVWSVYAAIIRPQWLVTIKDLPAEVTLEQLKAAATPHGAVDFKIQGSGANRMGVLAFSQNENAAKVLSGALQVGSHNLPTGTTGLNWFTRMLPGSRALFSVNLCLAAVHGWNMRRRYIYEKEKSNSQ
eukprot:NODE_7191_length_801_cov_96.339233_g6584_i0.p1 GENE.NODE_7191_length_801_cov_96.339233_g6584_i0~~NODE_7191_length_801_cov_96.339233_g6584_i0.p1  ORF type:complete len:221 (-),score=34.09 NODE_7191_length_801_cov_96.339233_g6584_i0:65-727(-)